MKITNDKIAVILSKIYKLGSYASISIIMIGVIEILFTKDAPDSYNFQITPHLKDLNLTDYNNTFFIGLSILLITPILGLLYLIIAYSVLKQYKTALMAFLILTLFGVVIIRGLMNQ